MMSWRLGPVLVVASLCLLLGPTLAVAQEPVTVDGRVRVSYTGLSLNRTTSTYDTLATITNTSADTLSGPMSLIVTSISVSTVSLANATGQSVDGHPLVGVPVPPEGLAPGASTGQVLLKFRNPTRARFTFQQSVTALVAAVDVTPPVVVITSPAPETLLGVGGSPLTVQGTVDDPTAVVRVENGPTSVTPSVQNGQFSAQVPLVEGRNMIVARATDSSSNVGTATVTVMLDTTPPNVQIESPANGLVTSADRVTVAGTVFDTEARANNGVVVNGVAATVVDRGFTLPDVPLVLGPNVIEATGTDRAGNRGIARITVVRQFQAGPRLSMIQGDSQTGPVNSTLPIPLEIALSDGQGNPMANQAVTFQVSRGDGLISGSPEAVQLLEEITDTNGRARVTFTVGSRSGAAIHRVQVSSPASTDVVEFSASAIPRAARDIQVVSGDNQRGAVGQPLTDPFIVVVRDDAANPLPGVPVTFGIVEGGGAFGGAATAMITTDASGRASVRLTLGPDEGVNNNLVTAAFQGQTTPAATFRASGRRVGKPEDTRISGIVLDNGHLPVPGVTLAVIGTQLSTRSDEEGRFSLAGVSAGPVHFLVNGATATRPGTWAMLMFELNVVQGQDNSFTGPIYILPLDDGNARLVAGRKRNQEVVLRMAGVPELAFTVAMNSVTCPNDAEQCTISITQVKQDKIPMPLPGGSVFPLAWTTQPPGVHFDPPMALTIPNNTGLGPGATVEMFSFDHDIGEFIPVATGTVNTDGSLVVSDPGQGITKGGWGGAAPPPPPKTCVGKTPACQKCDTNTGAFVADAGQDGQKCEDTDSAFSSNGVNITVDASCKGSCDSGSCKPGNFGIKHAKDGIDKALDKIFSADACGGKFQDPLKKKMQDALKSGGYTIKCKDNLRFKGKITQNGMQVDIDEEVCATTPVGGNTTTIGSLGSAETDCGALGTTVFHEMVHGVGGSHGEDAPTGCEKACFGFGSGDAANCK